MAALASGRRSNVSDRLDPKTDHLVIVAVATPAARRRRYLASRASARRRADDGCASSTAPPPSLSAISDADSRKGSMNWISSG